MKVQQRVMIGIGLAYLGYGAIVYGTEAVKEITERIKENFDVKTITKLQKEAKKRGEDLVVRRNGKDICVVL